MFLQTTKLPNLNIRKITNFPKNVVFALILFISSVFILKNETKKNYLKVLGWQTQLKTQQESIYQWEQILTENLNYRDGWIQLANSYYKIGNISKAKEAISKAKDLDPNNPTILNLMKLFE